MLHYSTMILYVFVVPPAIDPERISLNLFSTIDAASQERNLQFFKLIKEYFVAFYRIISYFWLLSKVGLLISIPEKLSLICLTSLITLVLLMWQWMDLFLRKNQILRCLDWLSLLNWIGVLIMSPLLKLPPRKLEPCFVLWCFFLLRMLCISINQPHGLAWNIVVMSELVVLVASCIR